MDIVKIQFLDCLGITDVVTYEKEISFTRKEILRIFQLAIYHNEQHLARIKFFYNGKTPKDIYYVNDIDPSFLYSEISNFIESLSWV